MKDGVAPAGRADRGRIAAGAEPAADGVPRRARATPEAVHGWILISPALLYALLLLALPLGMVAATSVQVQEGLEIVPAFTLANYRAALLEPIYRDLLLRSLGISLAVGVVTVLLAYPVAFFISVHGGRRKQLWLFLVTLPFWTSYLLRIMSWKVILGHNGILNTGLMELGLIEAPLRSLLYNVEAVVVTLAHSWAPFAILPIFVSIEKLDRSLVEAAADLGDGPVRRFLRVTLPLTLPGVLGALLIVMIPTVGDFVTPRLVGGKDGVMISNAIQAQFGRAANWPLGAALSVTTMVAVGLMAGAVTLAVRLLVRVLR